jgi:hypothetical protein
VGIRDVQMDDLFLVTYMKHPVNFSAVSTGCVCVCLAKEYQEKKKLRGFSPRANHTDRAAAAGRRS